MVEGDGERDWGYRGLGGKGFHQLECNVVRMWGGVFVSQKSLNDEERGGNCLLVPERSYGPAFP